MDVKVQYMDAADPHNLTSQIHLIARFFSAKCLKFVLKSEMYFRQ